uniref:Uncharacterized protein n=2 Tax=Sphaerodactylus townsendi TaxID=933632 RepID=A0ACB8G7Y7_9SAUR
MQKRRIPPEGDEEQVLLPSPSSHSVEEGKENGPCLLHPLGRKTSLRLLSSPDVGGWWRQQPSNNSNRPSHLGSDSRVFPGCETPLRLPSGPSIGCQWQHPLKRNSV